MGFRDAAAVAVVLVMLFSAVPLIVTDGSDAVPAGKSCDGVLIYEVTSKLGTNKEGFSLKNYGSTAVDLENFYLSDTDAGEAVHRYTINQSLSLAAGCVAVFVKTNDSGWFCETSATRSVYEYGDKGVAGGSFAFADDGDILHLYDADGKLTDTMVYGKGSTAKSSWSGDSVYMGNMDQGARRVESKDTDSYFDWTPIAKDYTAYSFDGSQTYTNAKVTPFVFPFCKGKPIFDTVMAAQDSVCISIYMLTSTYMISELKTLASQGKEVKLLLEKKPLGYSQDFEALKTLDNEPNAQVCFIGDGGSGTDRYSYVHNKYAIIDNSKVIVTSENWTSSNLGDGGNRGWGAVVEQSDYAAHMKTYFDNDFGGDDVITFAEYEAAQSEPIVAKSLPSHSAVTKYVNGLDYPTSTYTCDVRMYMSPDNTFKALQYYIDSASKRVYTEQMDVGESYQNLSATSPVSALVNAAGRGVDCRFLLAESGDKAKALIKELNDKGVKSARMTSNGYATMHNKGVIIDDAVWVSSVNWTENAFLNNRECGLYIMSPEVANFFADAYQVDWDHDYSGAATEPENEQIITWGAIALVVILVVLVILYKIFVPKKVQKAVRTASRGAKKSSGKKRSSKKR